MYRKKKFISLFKYEMLVLKKAHKIYLSLLWIFLISIILGAINKVSYAQLITVACLSLAMLIKYFKIVSDNFNDGSFEFCLINCGLTQVMLAKLCSLSLSVFSVVCLYALGLVLIYKISFINTMMLLFYGIAICIHVSIFSILAALSQRYKTIKLLLTLALVLWTITIAFSKLFYIHGQYNIAYIVGCMIIFNILTYIILANYLTRNL